MYYQSMPLYLRLIDLLKQEYKLVCNLPKSYKYSIGQDIINTTWEMIDLFIKAQIMHSTDPEAKKQTIESINYHQQCLQLRIRFLAELKLISLKQQARLNEQTVEIGKMIGSWLKNV